MKKYDNVLRTFPLMDQNARERTARIERARKLLFLAPPTGNKPSKEKKRQSTPQFMGVTVCGVDYNGL